MKESTVFRSSCCMTGRSKIQYCFASFENILGRLRTLQHHLLHFDTIVSAHWISTTGSVLLRFTVSSATERRLILTLASDHRRWILQCTRRPSCAMIGGLVGIPNIVTCPTARVLSSLLSCILIGRPTWSIGSFNEETQCKSDCSIPVGFQWICMTSHQ